MSRYYMQAATDLELEMAFTLLFTFLHLASTGLLLSFKSGGDEAKWRKRIESGREREDILKEEDVRV